MVPGTVRRVEQEGRSSHSTNDTDCDFHIRRDTDSGIPATGDNMYYWIPLVISVSHIPILSIHVTPIINLLLQFCCHLPFYNSLCLVSTLAHTQSGIRKFSICFLCSHQVQSYGIFGIKV